MCASKILKSIVWYIIIFWICVCYTQIQKVILHSNTSIRIQGYKFPQHTIRICNLNNQLLYLQNQIWVKNIYLKNNWYLGAGQVMRTPPDLPADHNSLQFILLMKEYIYNFINLTIVLLIHLTKEIPPLKSGKSFLFKS